MKKILLIIFMMISISAFTQNEKYKITEDDYQNNKVEMADIMRQNGKIYVVVGVILIIFVGITTYIYRLDQKMSKLEKEELGN
ncbi:CcmD family protein [Reichenbachiella versicolor]|uniref:CcmD family protein n=1 Tax=Reichenbachiella versicolor TaxID=1821036 RepID=UPI000D6E9B06|nr:CcmD family protein [Reichenbachiella versicolor]